MSVSERLLSCAPAWSARSLRSRRVPSSTMIGRVSR